MNYKIALAGNPNCGKTTMFNHLTGSAQYVGNWPGVTVEKKEGILRGHKEVIIQDLPGIYSLSPYTPEEVVARNYLIHDKPDVIINIVDGTNLERNLYLTTQLRELGIPMVIAINMMDLVEKNGDTIDLTKLGTSLGCEVVEMTALKGNNTMEAAKKALFLAKQKNTPSSFAIFHPSTEEVITKIEYLLGKTKRIPEESLRWYALKMLEKDEKIIIELSLGTDTLQEIEDIIIPWEKLFDDDGESIIINERYAYVGNIVRSHSKKGQSTKATTSDKMDAIVTNRWLALPIFAGVMFLVYYLSVTTVGAFLTDFTNDTLFGAWILPTVNHWLEAGNIAPWLCGLIVDGMIGGVGAVLGFVPQMLLLFLLLSFLEDCGYMARVAFIMDRIFRKFGLSGKSFIPMLIGSGCSVPGIMASRTIEQERDRRMTIMTTSFIPCGAKMPIIALIAGALFGGAWWVAPIAYFIGVGAVIVSGIILKKIKAFSGNPAPFIMELPPYHLPTAKNIGHSTWERGWSFIKRAGTIILLSSVILWFLQAFGVAHGSLQMVEDNNHSLLASIGQVIAPIFTPLGFGSWQATVGTITGLIAKENVVGTLGVLYGFAEVAESGMEYWTLFAKDFTALSAFSFMIFNLLCAPCFAAMGAIRREMNSGKWTWFAIGYLCIFAYMISLIVFQIGSCFMGNGFTLGTGIGFLLLIILFYFLLRKNKTIAKEVK